MATVQDNDVLLGRGYITRNHPGNIRFRALVKEKKPIFMESVRTEKKKVALAIVQEIFNMDPPGRFLVECGRASGADSAAGGNGVATTKGESRWVCVDFERAVEKVMHRLRENDKKKYESKKDKVNGKSGETSHAPLDGHDKKAEVVGHGDTCNHTRNVFQKSSEKAKIAKQEIIQSPKIIDSTIQRPSLSLLEPQNPALNAEADISSIDFLACQLGDADSDDLICDGFSADEKNSDEPLKNVFDDDAITHGKVLSSSLGGNCSHSVPLSSKDWASLESTNVAPSRQFQIVNGSDVGNKMHVGTDEIINVQEMTQGNQAAQLTSIQQESPTQLNIVQQPNQLVSPQVFHQPDIEEHKCLQSKESSAAVNTIAGGMRQSLKIDDVAMQKLTSQNISAPSQSPSADNRKPVSNGEEDLSLIDFLTCNLGDDDFDDFSCDDFSADGQFPVDSLENAFGSDVGTIHDFSNAVGGQIYGMGVPFSPDDRTSFESSKVASAKFSLQPSEAGSEEDKKQRSKTAAPEFHEVARAAHLHSTDGMPTQHFNPHQQQVDHADVLRRPTDIKSSKLVDDGNNEKLGAVWLEREKYPSMDDQSSLLPLGGGGSDEFNATKRSEPSDEPHSNLDPVSSTSSKTFASAEYATPAAIDIGKQRSPRSHNGNMHNIQPLMTQQLQQAQRYLHPLPNVAAETSNDYPLVDINPRPLEQQHNISYPPRNLSTVMSLKDWIHAAAGWITRSLADAPTTNLGQNESYLKVYLPNALQVAHQLVESFRSSFKPDAGFMSISCDTDSISLNITLISPNSLDRSELFFKGGHLVSDVICKHEMKLQIDEVNVLRSLCSIFYELFTLGNQCPEFDSNQTCNPKVGSESRDHGNIGHSHELALEKESRMEDPSFDRKLRKNEDRRLFHELVSQGVPVALQRLLIDLAKGQHCLELLQEMADSDAYGSHVSLTDILSDLNDMITDPDIFLYDIVHLPSRVHSSQGLPHDWANSLPTLSFTGRDKELSVLHEAADRVCPKLQQADAEPHASHTARHPGEIVWISGHSGEGKSCLVQNFRDHLTKHSKKTVGKRFEVLHCKFDFMNQSKPFHELALAFDQYFRDVLENAIDQKGLSDYLTSIVKVAEANVGQMGMKTFCDMIPTFRQIYSIYGMNWDSNSPVISRDENGSLDGSLINGKTRLHFIFRQFLHAMSSNSKSPFLIILDDCQFADQASLELLRFMILEFAGDGLFVIGCFRPDEVSESHPFTSFRRDIDVEWNARISTINIGCFVMDEVETMISRALSLPRRNVRPLSRILRAKTGGNPLFLHQYFDLLSKENLIFFSLVEKRWMWDLSKISKKPIDDNVARHFARKLHHLPQNIKTALKICSCFGTGIKFDALKLLTNNKIEDMTMALDSAVEEGFILKTEIDYQFSHDSILQAAYSLIPQNYRSKFHKVLATKIINSSSKEGNIDDSSIFSAVDQINRIDNNIIVDPQERKQYSQINLRAAQKAIKVLNFKSAIEYSKAGVALLENGHWQHSYALSLQLYDIASYASYVEGKHEDVQIYLKEVFTHAKCFDDKLEAHLTLVSSLSASGKQKEAFQCSLNVLAKMGESFLNLDEAVVKCTTVQTMVALSGKDKDSLNALQVMTDKSKLFVMRLLKEAVLLARMLKPKIGVVFAARMVQLTFSHGLAKESAFGIVCFGGFVMLVNVDEGFRLGKIAMSMLDNPISTCVRGSTATIFYGKLACFVEPIQASFEPLDKAYHDNMLVGDVNLAASAAMANCGYRLNSGDDLKLLSTDLTRFIRELYHLKQLNLVRLLVTCHHFLAGMVGHDPLESFLGGDFTSGNMLEYAISNNEYFLLSLILGKQLRLAVWFDDMEQVEYLLNTMEKSKADKETQVVHDPVASFPQGLSCFRLAKKSGNRKWYAKGMGCIEVLKRWTSVSKWNWEPRLALLEAECYFVNKDYEKAAESYRISTELSQKSRFVPQEGLGFEGWANMCKEVGDNKAAKANLLEALRCFKTWGAFAKARHIEQKLQNFV